MDIILKIIFDIGYYKPNIYNNYIFFYCKTWPVCNCIFHSIFHANLYKKIWSTGYTYEYVIAGTICSLLFLVALIISIVYICKKSRRSNEIEDSTRTATEHNEDGRHWSLINAILFLLYSNFILYFIHTCCFIAFLLSPKFTLYIKLYDMCFKVLNTGLHSKWLLTSFIDIVIDSR